MVVVLFILAGPSAKASAEYIKQQVFLMPRIEDKIHPRAGVVCGRSPQLVGSPKGSPQLTFHRTKLLESQVSLHSVVIGLWSRYLSVSVCPLMMLWFR